MRDADTSLRLRGLCKSYGDVDVLDDVNLDVRRGSVVAITGNNGSGKSTLLRIVATLTQPTDGRVEICGVDTEAEAEKARRHIGASMHSPMLYPDLTARENLHLFARLCRMDNAKSQVEAVADRFDFSSRLDERVRRLSHGFQKRISIARAVIHSPSLLLLDEPETGLDTTATASLKETITEWRRLGRSVVLATHTSALAHETADTSYRLRNGRLLLGNDEGTSDKC